MIFYSAFRSFLSLKAPFVLILCKRATKYILKVSPFVCNRKNESHTGPKWRGWVNNDYSFKTLYACTLRFPIPPEVWKSWSRSLIEMHLVRLSNAEAAASRRKSRGIIYALKQTGGLTKPRWEGRMWNHYIYCIKTHLTNNTNPRVAGLCDRQTDRQPKK